MPWKILCNRCGGILSVDDSLSVCSCLYCGARNIVAEGEVYHEMDHKTDREELFTQWVKNVVYNPEEGIAIGALEKRFIIEYPDDIRCKIFKYDMGSFVGHGGRAYISHHYSQCILEGRKAVFGDWNDETKETIIRCINDEEAKYQDLISIVQNVVDDQGLKTMLISHYQDVIEWCEVEKREFAEYANWIDEKLEEEKHPFIAFAKKLLK